MRYSGGSFLQQLNISTKAKVKRHGLVFAKVAVPFLLAAVFAWAFLLMMLLPAFAQGGFEISKSASADPVRAGELFTYSIVFTNNTGVDALALVTDTIPSGVTVTDMGSGSLNGNTIEWTSISINDGESDQVSFTGYVTRVGTISNDNYRVSSGSSDGVGTPLTTTIIPNDPAQVTIEAAPTSITVDPAATVALTLTVADTYGNPVADSTVISVEFDLGSIDGMPAGSTVTGTTSGGVLLKTLNVLTVAGTSTITASASGVSPAVEMLTFNPDTPDSLVVSSNPISISTIGGETSTITAIVYDQYNNPVNNMPVTFTTTLNQLNGSGSTVVENTANGQATVTLAGTVAGTSTITASVNSVADEITQVYLAPGPATQIRFNPPPTVPVTLEANGVSSTVLQLLVLDMNDNRVTQPTPVTITTNLGTLTGGGSSYTEVTTNGLVQVTLTSPTSTGTANVQAFVNIFTTDRAVNFLAGPPASIGLEIEYPEIVADGVSTAVFTATAYDAYSNIVADIPVTFTFSTAQGSWIEGPAGTSLTGVLNRTLQSNTTLGTTPVTVTVEGLITPTLGAIDFIVGPPDSVIITATTTSITVANTVPLTFTVFDSVGHIVPTIPITVFSTIGTVNPASSGNTDDDGQLQRNLFSTQSGNATLSVNSYNGSVSVNGDTVITFLPDDPANGRLASGAPTIIADGEDTTVITATVTDIHTNPVPGVTPNITYSAGTLLGSGVTDANGVTTRTLRSSTNLETATLDLVGLTAASIDVRFVVGPAYTATLSASPLTTATVRGEGFPDEIGIDIFVSDRTNHAIVNQTVYLTSTFGSNLTIDCGTGINGQGVTNGAGIVSCTLQSIEAGEPDVYIDGIQAVGDVISFSPGPEVYVVVTPTHNSFDTALQLVAGQVFTFTAVAYDTYDNPIPDITSFLWTVLPSAPPSDPRLGNGQINNGVFMGTQSGYALIMAQVGSALGLTYIEIEPGPAVQANISADPTSTPVVPPFGGLSELTITVSDAFGNVVSPGFTPVVATTLGSIQGTGSTDNNGIAVSNLNSTFIGTAIIDITNLITVTGDTTVYFTSGPPSRVRVTSSGSQLHANGSDTADLTIEALDDYNNAVSAGFYLNVSALPGSVSCPSNLTDALGQVYCTLTAPTTEGTADFTNIQYNSVPLALTGDSDTVTFFVDNLDYLQFAPTMPVTVTAGVSLAITVDGYDNEGALVPANRLTYVWTRLPPFHGTLLPNNTRIVTFTGNTQGTAQISVIVDDDGNPPDVPSGARSRLININVTAAPPAIADIAVVPPSITANGVSTTSINLSNIEDALGNTVNPGEVITFTIGPRTFTDTVSAGIQIQRIVTSTTQAGTYPISATNSAGDALTLSGSAGVTFLPDSPAQAAIVSVNPPSVIANGTDTTEIVLWVRDQFDNNVQPGLSLTISGGLGATIFGSSPTAAYGLITCTLQAGLVLGSAPITVSDGLTQFLSSGSVPLVAGPPVSATVVAGTTVLTAGDSPSAFTFNVEDAWGHPVSGYIITPTLTPALGDFSGSRVPVNGQVFQSLTPFTSTGPAMVGVQGLTVTGNITLTFVPNVAALARVQPYSNSVTVGDTVALTISITDLYGNIISPTDVVITSTLGGTLDGGASPVTRTTAVNTGRVNLSLNSTNAGTETMALSGPAGPISLHPASEVVQFQPDTQIEVILDETGAISWMAGTPLTITASSRDVYGNIIDPWTPLSYVWSQTSLPGGAGYGQISDVDPPNNRTVRFLPLNVGENHIQARNSTFQSEALTITVTPAPPSRGLIQNQPPGIVANEVSTTPIVLSNLQDAFGNDVDNGHIVTVTVDSIVATGVVSGGEVSVIMTASQNAGTHPISAESSAGAITLNPVGFNTVTYLAGPAVRARVAASQRFIPVGTMTATLVITVYDQYFNLVEPGTTITVTVENADVIGSDTTVDGKTTRTLHPYALGNSLIAIESESGTISPLLGDDELVFVAGDAARAIVTVGQDTLIGDGSSSTSVDVSIRDGSGFAIDGAGTAVITTSRGTVAPTTTLAVDGDFNVTFTSDQSVGMVDFFISYNGAPLDVVGDTLELIAAPAYSASLSATPDAIQIDTADQSQLVFSLFDQWNNPIAGGEVVTVTASLGTIITPTTRTSVGNAVTMTLTPGTVRGPVSFTVEASSAGGPLLLSGDTVEILAGNIHHINLSPPGSQWITAGSSLSFSAFGYDRYDNLATTGPFNWRVVYGSGDGSLDNNGAFTGTLAGTLGIQAYTATVYSPEKSVTILPGALYTTVVSANPLTVPVGGVPSQIFITARDFYGNLVADGTSASVTTDLGRLVGSGTTENGVLTRTLLSSDFSGRANIYVNNVQSSGDTIFFSPRAWVTSVPTTLVSDGVGEAEVRVRILDENGLPTGDFATTITTTLGTLNYNDCTQDGDGMLCTLIASTDTGVATIYADGFPAQGVVTFTTGTPSMAYISANPQTVTINGLSTSTLTIEVQDTYGHTIPDYSSSLSVSSSLGAISGFEPTINGVTHRILSGGSSSGVAALSVTGLTVTGTTEVDIIDVVANISASPKVLMADGFSQSILTILLEDSLGQVLTQVNAPVDVSTSLGTISASSPTVNGITQRVLTSATTSGIAGISVGGFFETGDTQIQFVGTDIINGDFENGLDAWLVGTDPVTATPGYSATNLTTEWFVGITETIRITPRSGTKMARLGATTLDNTPHDLSETWLKQSIYVSPTGITQISFWYRLLSYDVSVGSQSNGSLRWDPFEVSLNDNLVYTDGFPWSADWQDWRDGPPDPPPLPQDTGWQQSYLTVSDNYAGQIVTLEFRLPNDQRPEDNTWVYIDNVEVTYVEQSTYNGFLPIIIR